jgi:hypothetical protein
MNAGLAQRLTSKDRTWLIVFDNADSWTESDLSDYLPRCAGSAIITSRSHALAGPPATAWEQIETFDSGDSYSLFKSLVKSWNDHSPDEVLAAHELLQELDGLALAIQQIAGLINIQESSIVDFLALYKRESAALHSHRAPGDEIFSPHSLDTVWSLSFDYFAKSPSTLNFLGVLSVLSPDSIAQELFLPDKTVELTPQLTFCQSQME